MTEVHQVLVICEDLDGKGGSVEIVSPGFQSMDDREELLVIDVVVPFCRDEQLREIEAGVPVAIQVGLEEDGIRSIL